MEKVLAVIGMCGIVGIAYLFSTDKKAINWKSVGFAFFGQVLLALLMIKTPAWKLIEWLSNGMSWILAQATEGIDFVFGGISDNFVFFINSLLPIVFVSSLVGILFHFNILQKFISLVGKFIARYLDVDTLVATNSIANMLLGQSESLFVTKSYLPSAKDSVIFATMVGGMTSISVSVMGLYTSYGASMEWILVSVPLTVLSTFALTQIIMPTRYEGDNIEVENDKGVNFIETMLTYGLSGFQGVVSISVALMIFLSLVGMINNFIAIFNPDITLQSMLSIFFLPISWLMGVSGDEVHMVAEILSMKLVTNEAVAFALPQFSALSESAKAMMTVALCGFAGFGSIGILCSAYVAIAKNKVSVVAKLGVKALIVATFVNILTAAVVGLFL